MKKLSVLMVGLVLAFCLAGCSNSAAPGSNTTASPEPSASPSPTASATPDGAATGAGNTLVVYFSATGNTEEAANYIAAATNADVFELEPVEPYTDDDLNWTDENSRVVYEHDNPDARDVELVATTVPDWETYDTVFIGYPIWWNLAPRIIDTFIETHHLAGKTLIPFATSGGSGITNSVGALKKAYPDLNWKEGKLLNRMDENGIREWIGKASKD